VDFSLAPLLTVAVIVFLAGFVQGTVGFAFALVATPLLVLAGVPVVTSVLTVASSISIQSATATFRLLPHVPWREVQACVWVRLIGLPLGTAVLLLLTRGRSDELKMVLGAIVVATVVVMLLWRQGVPYRRPSQLIGYLAFLISGFLQGLASMGGPPMALWAMAQGWDPIRTRAFLLAVMALAAPVQVVVLVIASGGGTAGVLYGLVAAPVIVLGTLLGVRLGNRLRSQHLRLAMMLVLLATGLSSLLSPLLG
jgi:uncharacterized membrane protein YfcA